MRFLRHGIVCAAAVTVFFSGAVRGAEFKSAVVVIDPAASPIEKKAAAVLSEEIERRTQLRLRIAHSLPSDGGAIVIGTLANAKKLAPTASAGMEKGKPEGFTVVTAGTASAPVAVVAGNDSRGVFFGTGYLLRQMKLERQHIELPAGLRLSTAPAVAVRGHQLGYRPKPNAYDAWNVAMWEQYIRELALFGTNTIELIPPISDDDGDSPHFPLPPAEMFVEMSRIAAEYDIDVSVWYPALEKDYADPKTVEKALAEWEETLKKLPRLDAVFVPGGDPGHTEPTVLLSMLEKQAARLRKTRPKLEFWVSPQGFDQKWMDTFYALLDRQPTWLTGVVYGPQVRAAGKAFRERVPKRYRVRFYPDITHNWRAEFAMPDWDPAYAVTEGREPINPRPVDQQTIFRYYRSANDGFVTYSEGCNDDVNKFIWSMLGWSPDRDIRDILRDFSRFFMGAHVEEGVAAGLMALEENWRGPLLSNGHVEVTLQQFQDIERQATPQLKLNWRFQQALYRAYYDAYVRSRLMTETRQEEQAMGELMRFETLGLRAIDRAEAVLDEDQLTGVARARRARVYELAEALYQSIHMQLSVPRYGAIGVERGANLDGIDFALNNRFWLKNQFAEIRKLESQKDRVDRVNAILHWTDPGPGGFYDDLGSPGQQPHLVRGRGFDQDPGYEATSRGGMGRRTEEFGWRYSWMTHAEALYDYPLQMKYTGLDRSARYKVRVVYAGDAPKLPIRMVANGVEIHPLQAKPAQVMPQEFTLPAQVTASGTLTLEWSGPSGMGSNGRAAEASEVWLIRIPDERPETGR